MKILHLNKATTHNYPTFSDLPHSAVLDLIAGPFADVIRTVWQGHLIEYLTAPDVRRHVWHSWLSVQPDPDTYDQQMLDFLSYSKSRHIIADRFGCCPDGYLPVLKRLGTQARRPETYRNLFRVLAGGGHLAKLVHHSKEIHDHILACLTSIPNDQFSTAIVSRLLSRSVDPDKFHGTVWIANQLKSVIGPDQVIHHVSKSSNPMRALRKLVLEMPFPEPPFDCRHPLVPVRSIDELRSLSKKFRNCLTDIDRLSDVVFSIQAGQQYLYHWGSTDEPALILLQKFASVGWVIDEAFGLDNRHLSETTLRQIEDVLAGYPTICPAWPLHMTIPSRGWFFE